MIRLSNLQAEILKRLCSQLESTPIRHVSGGMAVRVFDSSLTRVSGLARELGRRQSTVFNSVRALLKNKYLDSDRYAHDHELVVTDKGAAAALTLGIGFDTVVNCVSRSDLFASTTNNYLKSMRLRYPRASFPKDYSLRDKQIINYIRKIAQSTSHKDNLMKRAVSYALENDYLHEGNFSKLSKGELQRFKLFVALEFIDTTGDILTLKQFVNKYGIDKSFLRRYLERQKLYLESAIRQLS
jgi:hypothetical protein